MKLTTRSFRGMAPRMTPRELPPNAAVRAINARLLSGDLEAWRRPLMAKQLAVEASGPVQTIALLDDDWLSWQQEVEVARGVIPGDDTFRTYITGLDLPRFTNKALATTGAEPFPVETRPLGVPAPDDVPELAVTAPDESSGNVALVNPGAETGDDTGWTQTTPDMAVHENGDVPGFQAYEGTHWFYGGANASGEYFQSIDIETAGIVNGQNLTLGWRQASGANASQAQLGLRFLDATSNVIGETFADMAAIAPALTWQQRSVTAAVPADTATVRVVIKFLNVGGTETDAYIDAITLDAADADYTSDGSDLTSWTVSPDNSGTEDSRRVQQVDIGGEHGMVFKLTADELVPWLWRQFAFNRASSFQVEYDVRMNSERCVAEVVLGATGGAGDGLQIRLTGVTKSSFTGLDERGVAAATIAQFSAAQRPTDQWLRVTMSAARSGTTAFAVRLSITNKVTGVVLVDDAELTIAAGGTEFVLRHYSNRDADGQATFYDNILVRVTPTPPVDEAETLLTSYLYRFVNEFGEASAPSLPSRTIQRSDGVVVTITTPTEMATGLADYGVTLKQIYRAATGASGTVFRFVAEIPLSQADYIDTLSDAELGEVLDSEDWDLPPEDLRYILALPNGIMVGASKNQLCFSVRNRPHAWPVKWRLATDTTITGLGNVDTSVIIGTQSFVYTASGNDPSAYSMSKPVAPHACQSHRSFAYLLTIGAVFAGPDGLMAAAGPTQVVNLTENIFTREQWRALDPTSILGAAHDDVYFFFWDNGIESGGYALDTKPTGFGLIELGMHASALYVDPVADALYLVLDAYDEPASELLPAPTGGALANVDGHTVFEFDADEELMRYSWTGKLWLLPHPMALQWARVRAQDFAELEIEVTADAAPLRNKLVAGNKPFRLPLADDYSELSWTLVGTSRVRSTELADDVLELE